MPTLVQRFSVFVDAGYLYAASGKLLFGVTDRSRLALDYAGMVEALRELAGSHCPGEHLRTYWYDGARDLRPTAQHVEIANLPGVKLRLGRIVRGEQKGVDSRIVRDLIILASERAISDAYLLGGDEDLREGVIEAQERGVRVSLIAVEPLHESNVSAALGMDADDVLVLDQKFVEPHFSERELERVPSVEPADPTDPASLGRAYASAYAERATPEAIAAVLAQRPRIPPDIDRKLLYYACRTLSVQQLDDESRKLLRGGFWAAVSQLVPT